MRSFECSLVRPASESGVVTSRQVYVHDSARSTIGSPGLERNLLDFQGFCTVAPDRRSACEWRVLANFSGAQDRSVSRAKVVGRSAGLTGAIARAHKALTARTARTSARTVTTRSQAGGLFEAAREWVGFSTPRRSAGANRIPKPHESKPIFPESQNRVCLAATRSLRRIAWITGSLTSSSMGGYQPAISFLLSR